ncbi:hypothetical protein BJ508DRAFT_227462 [Ascobolus immersus RN42]|uniref:PCI domain-containing protein n=1 Tax=Ascobolus immersus RN42 TaxID=1160509 RepID=A0A3N4I1M1_ASCIM|nr:hypothetical protein BJ508DRAFT_227462 [Ascobolus immersus RN42]
MASEDVEMKTVEETQTEEKKEVVDEVTATVNDIKANFPLLEQGVTNFDSRFMLKVLRTIPSVRRRLTPEIFRRVIKESHPAHEKPTLLLSVLGDEDSAMDIEAPATQSKGPTAVIPEVDVYLHLLAQIFLLDQNALEAGAQFSTEVVKKVHSLNRRTVDPLAGQVYFYYSRFHELLPAPALLGIRSQLLASLRTATLRKDIDTQAQLITLLLRNYLITSHINQADLLIAKTAFPPTASNNLIIRYEYYLGKIRAIQLDYSAAHEHLQGAIRKAPQTSAAAGFIQAANKLNVVVELLMGDIPDRALFRNPMLEKPLKPYFLLVQAVRVGELDAFNKVVDTYGDVFKKDGTYTLVIRLRQSVIKTGIRTMSLSYSRISLREICVRLDLDSEQSAEYIVAKAIRDGVIEATLNHEKGYMQSKELLDIYATQEPTEQFHARISACMDMHNECIKAMRFPMNQHRLELKNAQEARDRERELAKEIQEGDLDDSDTGGDYDGL